MAEYPAYGSGGWDATLRTYIDGQDALALKKWAAATAVTAGEIVVAPDGKTIQRTASGTTRANYDATEQALWAVVSGGDASALVKSGQPVPALNNWWRQLGDDPVNAVFALFGDSTSTEANDIGLHSSLRNVHTGPLGPLAGMTADAAHAAVDFGNNGASLQSILTNYDNNDTSAKSLRALIALAPHLIVFCFGINDVRTGTTTKAQLVARIIRAVDILRAALPNTDIVLRIPNTLATNNLGGANYVTGPTGAADINPAGAAQAYSDIMRQAYLSLRGRWANVTVLDIPRLVFGTKSIATTDTNQYTDQLHPAAGQYGYAAIASAIAEHIALPREKTPSWGWSVAHKRRLSDGTYSQSVTPWNATAAALYDNPHFELIMSGVIASGADGYVRIGDFTTDPAQVGANDLVELPDGTVHVITSISINASGQAVPNGQFSATTITAAQLVGMSNMVARVWRVLDEGDNLLGSMRSTKAVRVVHVGRVQAAVAGTSFDLGALSPTNAHMTSRRWSFGSGAKLYVARYPSWAAPTAIDLSTFTSQNLGNNVRFTNIGALDLSAYVGRLVVLTDTSPEPAGRTDKAGEAVSVAAGTVTAQSAKDVTVTVTGARFARPHTAVVAHPRTVIPAGVLASAYVTAADTVTVRFINPTTADVVVGTFTWDFHLLR